MIDFSLQFPVKKEGWGGGGMRQIKFVSGQGDVTINKSSGKTMTVTIGPGLPSSSRMYKQFIGKTFVV